ncbi:MAG: hypothetical protein HeimC3_51880 [Candidatus Heimdallarchaeota archaeon LC_3]|nr:MAG: hypothetical protein HeimC3_51880 [Candidatus Heimdallarchaeota archaeon LC_3]
MKVSNIDQKNAEVEVVNPSLFQLIFLGGVIGGIAGGLAFGILLLIQSGNTDFFLSVSNLFVKFDDVTLGILSHIGFAILFGILFGLVLIFLPQLGSSQPITVVTSLFWGFFLWVIAANVIFRVFFEGLGLEASTFIFDLDYWLLDFNIQSLTQHLIYGLLLGLTTWNLPKILERTKIN